jgi:hypothetical protein
LGEISRGFTYRRELRKLDRWVGLSPVHFLGASLVEWDVSARSGMGIRHPQVHSTLKSERTAGLATRMSLAEAKAWFKGTILAQASGSFEPSPLA